MKILFSIVLATFMASAARAADNTPVASQAPTNCNVGRIASLDMTMLPDGEIAVPVTINDQEMKLIVDTGDIYSGIGEESADALHLKRGNTGQAFTFLGNLPAYQYVEAHSFKLGPMSGDDLRLLVVPSQMMRPNVDGLLGPNVLKGFDVEFDFAHGKFNIFSQNHCPHAVVYWTKTNYAQVPMHVDDSWHISVPVTLNGKSLTAVIDSGADRSTMSLATLKELFGVDEKNPALKQSGTGSINGTARTTMYRYPFDTLSLEGVKVQSPDIDIIPAETYGTQNPQLIIGINVLRQLRLYIAYKEQMLYATPAEAK
jgi:predicted aspartyl protease